LHVLLDLPAERGFGQDRLPILRPRGAHVRVNESRGEERKIRRYQSLPLPFVGKAFAVEEQVAGQRDRRIVLSEGDLDFLPRPQRRLLCREKVAAVLFCQILHLRRRGQRSGRVELIDQPAVGDRGGGEVRENRAAV